MSRVLPTVVPRVSRDMGALGPSARAMQVPALASPTFTSGASPELATLSLRLEAIAAHVNDISKHIPTIDRKLDAIMQVLAQGSTAVMPPRGADSTSLTKDGHEKTDKAENAGQVMSDESGSDSDDHDDSDEVSPTSALSTPNNAGDLKGAKAGVVVELEVVEGATILNDSDAWMINPKNAFRMSWDLGVVMPLLIYLAIVMPFRLTFENEARAFTPIYWWEFLIDMLFLVDIVLNFRTGVLVSVAGDDGREGTEDEEQVEYDRYRVAVSYGKTWFALDVISGVPFALLELIMSGDAGALKSAKSLKLLRFLKLGRLLKMDKILANLDQNTMDYIEDFFQSGTTRSAVLMLRLVLIMAFCCHIFGCGWVVIGKISSGYDIDSWLLNEIRGPFVSEDTTGINGDGPVYSIYIAAFYFCLTTMTSVGYGDVLPKNNMERLYVIFLEFCGAIVFATTIAAITSVVTSMDMNARKTAEQLDAVASFVAVKRFPEEMARRIRRHFRRFYSLKSAIDESKIFSELSAGLRKEVSQYLVVELMGQDSFFMTMPESLWPQLLPLLRPMAFDKEEFVCKAGDESQDVFVVESGLLAATMMVPGEEHGSLKVRTRFVTMGGAVNVMHGMGIWYKCLETVEALTAVQSYAVSAVEFSSLFSTDVDKVKYKMMQRHERRNFLMMADESAPTPMGRPVCHTCFTLVDVAVVSLKIFSGDGGRTDALDHEVYGIVDLVNVATGKPFAGPVGELWKLKTKAAKAKTAHLARDLDGDGKADGFEEVFIGEEARWSDITSAFDDCALRVRLVSAGSRGQDTVIGRAALRLPDFDAAKAPLHGATVTARRAARLAAGGAPRADAEVAASFADKWCEERPLRDGEFDIWCNLGHADAAADDYAAATAKAEAEGNLKRKASRLSMAGVHAVAVGSSQFFDEVPDGASGAWAKLRVFARRPARPRKARGASNAGAKLRSKQSIRGTPVSPDESMTSPLAAPTGGDIEMIL